MDEICNLLGCILGVVGLVQQFPILSGFAEATLSMSTPLLRSCVKSSVVNTTAAMSPVGIK